MKLKVVYILAFICLLLSCKWGPVAQTITARAASSTVGVGQEFEVRYDINDNVSGFEAPSFTGFDVLSGPNQSSSINIINGSVSQSISYSFYIVARQEGTFTIQPATVHIGSKTLKSNSLTITVMKGNAPPPNTGQNANAQPPPTNGNTSQDNVSASDLNKKIFVKLNPNKTKCFKGEGVILTLKLYALASEFNPQDFGPLNTNPPAYNGFYTEDIPHRGEIIMNRENINGTIYWVCTLNQTILFPEHSGKLKIDPLKVEGVVGVRVKSRDPFDIFSQFFGSQMKRENFQVSTDAISLEVQKLPESGKEFNGAVGHYTIKASLDKNKVKANDAINLNVTVSGEGELKLIDSLPFTFPPDFDHYDPKITDHITVASTGISGSRTFNYLLIPRHEGKFKIPSTAFTYFDPAKKNYSTVSVPEMNIEVEKGNNTPSQITVAGNTSKEDVKLLATDIRFIHLGHEPVLFIGSHILYSIGFYSGIGLPVLAFLGFVFFRRRYIELHKDIVSLRKREATHMAKKRLKVAHSFISTGNKERFYAEILKAINGYLSDKFGIPVADLSRETINQSLSGWKLSEKTIYLLKQCLDICEYASYAPSAIKENFEEIYNNTVLLITKLEDETGK